MGRLVLSSLIQSVLSKAERYTSAILMHKKHQDGLHARRGKPHNLITIGKSRKMGGSILIPVPKFSVTGAHCYSTQNGMSVYQNHVIM